MLSRLSFALLLSLSACAPDPLSRELASLDLADMGVVQNLGRNLAPDERVAFNTYIAIHRPDGPGFCGERLVDKQGKEPATVGEAINLTLARIEADKALRRAAAQPKSPAEMAQEKKEFLLAQREQIEVRRSLLFAQYGPDAERMPEWREIDRELAEYDRQLAGQVASPVPEV